jgi:two-component system, chemotaxis family, protein-glutamate methylesterase/glutaminase
MIKVLIVDDSAVVRSIYKQLLERDPLIRVIGTANDPYIAVQKIQREKPDVITLDIHMPRMDGFTFLKKIMTQAPMPVIVVSSYTSQHAENVLKALEAGAVDVMPKPDLSSIAQVDEYSRELIDKVKGAVHARVTTQQTQIDRSASMNRSRQLKFNSRSLIAIGASTGGTEALAHILRELPATMPPILVVQHMPEKFTASFAQRLNSICDLQVKEAVHGDKLQSGTVYIAPGGKHMTIDHKEGRLTTCISDGDPVNRHKPSVNVLFNSIAQFKCTESRGIILTGMGDDGATGLLAIHQQGGYTIAQDEETSVVFGMPFKAIRTGGVSAVLPIDRIAQAMIQRYVES